MAPGTSCLATIKLSLRDKKPFTPGAPRVELTLMGDLLSFLIDGERQPNLSGVEHDQLNRFIGRETTMRRLDSFRHRLPGMQNRALSCVSSFYRKMAR